MEIFLVTVQRLSVVAEKGMDGIKQSAEEKQVARKKEKEALQRVAELALEERDVKKIHVVSILVIQRVAGLSYYALFCAPSSLS